jgi:hypothetical protein
VSAGWVKLHAQDQPVFPLDNFYAERKPWARSVLRNVRFGLSTGYGNTFFRHRLDGFGVLQAPDSAVKIFDAADPNAIYSAWVNRVAPSPWGFAPTDFRVNADTARLGFRANGWNIPIKATIHYEYQGRFRIGGGYSYQWLHMGSFRPMQFEDRLADHAPPRPVGGWMRHYFGMLGVSFYRVHRYLFTADVNVGGFRPGRNFDNALIRRGIYVNAGVTIEKELSEYLRLFLRPSFELKNFTLAVPGARYAITHNINTFYLNVGLTYSIPELPRCFHKSCRTQINHAHGNREYRSRVHPIYKKQNPGYGENQPSLIKYKRGNRRKMNPY